MDKKLWKYILLAALVLVPSICCGQAKIYTKKNKLTSIQTCTTKMVLSGNALLDARFKEEVDSRWHFNPFEFCTGTEYDKAKTNVNYCFLRFTTSEGVCFLTFSKGGKENDTDPLKQPVDIISVPIGNSELNSGLEIEYLGDFLGIIQDFAESAAESDRTNILGLKYCNTRSTSGKEMVTILIIPSDNGRFQYELKIDSNTRELLRYRRIQYDAE